MEYPGIQSTRIQPLNDRDIRDGDYVLYWMQQSQRARMNHALEYAVGEANRLGLPLVAGFGLMAGYPEANRRHYCFMLEGLEQTRRELEERAIGLVIRRGEPAEIALQLGERAALIVCDRGYLRHQKEWRRRVANRFAGRVVQVESDVVVPVEIASTKAEYAARTIRPRIQRRVDEYLVELPSQEGSKGSLDTGLETLSLEEPEALLKDMKLDAGVGSVSRFFRGGTAEAEKRFDYFLEEPLCRYDAHRNQPQTDDVSHMSPYLHFGQISPLYLALKAQERSAVARQDVDTFLEELIVRRELAVNFVEYTEEEYDRFSCLPDWAIKTLEEHEEDPREPLYSREQMEAAETGDDYWNAAMREMKFTGFMHNYMRMYWGKKILEWSASPREAYEVALTMNNRYFLDGRDPSSYAGVAWVFGLHDRAWAERSVFGKVRYMAASGLERKCDIEAYVEKIDSRVAQSPES